MVSKKYERLNNNIKELIKEGEKFKEEEYKYKDLINDKYVEKILLPVYGGRRDYEKEGEEVNFSFQVSKRVKYHQDCCVALEYIFSNKFDYVHKIKKLSLSTDDFDELLGLLKSASTNIEKGYLKSLESQIENEVFNDLLQESKHFIYQKEPPLNKDIGAMLLRIVLEDNLKRICGREEIGTKTKKGLEETPSNHYRSFQLL